MKCPACPNTLQEVQAGDIKVDVCRNGCGGIWFDNFEFKKVDEQHESAGDSLLEIEKNPHVVVDRTGKRQCPRCEDQPMLQHFVSAKQEVEVDECPACGGIWLDAGELGAIRDQFATDEERSAAAQEYFQNVFGGELAKMKARSEADARRARGFARAFRFLCPTAYISGKQDWGAF
jgi:Zn-finger nucleic acid-binding protein